MAAASAFTTRSTLKYLLGNGTPRGWDIAIATSSPTPGFCTDEHIGQDTGDVLALMAEGYNFDGAQSARRPPDDDSRQRTRRSGSWRPAG